MTDQREPNVPALSVADKPCRACAQAIPAAAIKCVHCSSFQNWRRYLDLSSTSLAMLVALLSVATVTAPIMRETFTSRNSRVILTKHSAHGDHIVFIVANSGDRPALVDGARIESIFFPHFSWPQLVLSSERDASFIPTGSKAIQFEVQFSAGPNRTSEYADLLQGVHRSGDVVGKIEIDIINFSGTTRTFTLPLTSGELQRIQDAHIEFCVKASPDSMNIVADEPDQSTLPKQCRSIDDGSLADFEMSTWTAIDECQLSKIRKKPIPATCKGSTGPFDGPLERMQAPPPPGPKLLAAS